MAQTNFADRLLEAIAEKKTPLIVGLDPVYDQLPAAITGHRELNDEGDVHAAVDAVVEFSNRVLKIIAPHVAAVKINSAFFETYFWDGLEAYSTIIQEAAAHGLTVIGDVKRADVGHSAKQYAAATLSEPEFGSMDDLVAPDAVTVNPYFGIDGVQPFIDIARDEGKGVFVLVRTSNASAGDLQEFKDASGEPLYMHVGKLVEKWGADLVGKKGYSAVGAVVGATNAQQLAELRHALPHTLFLVPGLGAQGASYADVAKAFKSDGTGALVNAGRSIIYAHKEEQYANFAPENWEKAVETALVATKRQLAEALGQ